MDELLVKYLLGEASAAEQQQVQQWIAESDANNKYYYHFKLLWEESRSLAMVSDTDEHAAWARFEQRIQRKGGKTINMPSPYKWVKIAASIILLVGCAILAYYMNNNNEQDKTMAYHPAEAPVNKVFPGKKADTNMPVAEHPTEVINNDATGSVTATNIKPAAKQKDMAVKEKQRFMKQEFHDPLQNGYHRTKEFICNATPCPLEICIIQRVKCPDGEPSAISTCSVLEPDESGQLRYKAFDKITKNCNATIDEIRIRQVNTGETIVLNADSKPATAEDFFSYITGQKKGNILAGIFQSDCDNQSDNCGLTFDNNFGRLILQ